MKETWSFVQEGRWAGYVSIAETTGLDRAI